MTSTCQETHTKKKLPAAHDDTEMMMIMTLETTTMQQDEDYLVPGSSGYLLSYVDHVADAQDPSSPLAHVEEGMSDKFSLAGLCKLESLEDLVEFYDTAPPSPTFANTFGGDEGHHQLLLGGGGGDDVEDFTVSGAGGFGWISQTFDLGEFRQPTVAALPSVQSSPESSRLPSPAFDQEDHEDDYEDEKKPVKKQGKKRKAETPEPLAVALAVASASLPVLPPKKRKVGVVMTEEEKRERNRVSALKYRMKQRVGADVTEDKVGELEHENQMLHFSIMKEKQTIAELRQLLIRHGVLPAQ